MRKRVAVMILGPLGDVINTSGIFKHLRKIYPEVNLSIITLDRSVPAVAGITEIDNVYSFDKNKTFPVFHTIKFALSLRGKFDTIIVLDNSLRSAYLSFFTGAKRRVGRGGELRELFLTDIVPYLEEERKMKIPVCEHYSRCLKPLGIYKENIKPCFSFSQEDENSVNNLLKENGLDGKPLIGLCPACHDESKSMHISDAASIIKKINEQNKYKVVVVGGSDISALVSELKEFSNIEYYDFTGKTKFTETAALINKCSKFVSIDTSCMHLAFARKVPTVSIFFSNLYKKWGPIDLNNNALYLNMKSKNIEIDKVIEKLKSLPEKSYSGELV